MYNICKLTARYIIYPEIIIGLGFNLSATICMRARNYMIFCLSNFLYTLTFPEVVTFSKDFLQSPLASVCAKVHLS